jgi:hypothetical protein
MPTTTRMLLVTHYPPFTHCERGLVRFSLRPATKLASQPVFGSTREAVISPLAHKAT